VEGVVAVIDRENVLKGLTVQDAMRRLAIDLFREASIEQAIRCTIKFKANALLVINEQHEGIGVVSKTDLMGAYYAGLPFETPVESIMVGSPVFCQQYDSLDAALDKMRAFRIHRLYVAGDHPAQAVGVLAYPDIVGLLYRYCRRCKRSILHSRHNPSDETGSDRFRVREVMTDSLQTHEENESLLQVMEGLSTHHLGAVLINDRNGSPVGVVSKTDLMIAYKHGIAIDTPAKAIMNSPVHSCDHNDLLAVAVQKMIFSDIHRSFVHKGELTNLVGVLSLSDAARVRSGSCRACVTSRIEIAKNH
jgi:signal-transduction protein with cAMP-binding, CBS, and nucleotidyltransferase domain